MDESRIGQYSISVTTYPIMALCVHTMKWIKLERDILKNGNYLYSTEYKGSEFT